MALTAASAFRSMQGTWTNPAIGSHVRPRLCSLKNGHINHTELRKLDDPLYTNHADFSRILHLIYRSTHHSRKSCSSHRACHTDLALATDLRRYQVASSVSRVLDQMSRATLPDMLAPRLYSIPIAAVVKRNSITSRSGFSEMNSM